MIDLIASLARSTLARDAVAPRKLRRGLTTTDWEAWDAIAAAARASGLDGQLLGYVTRARTLRAMARDYVARYVQAYGPVENWIDVSGHGSGARAPRPPPQIVEVGS